MLQGWVNSCGNAESSDSESKGAIKRWASLTKKGAFESTLKKETFVRWLVLGEEGREVGGVHEGST